MNGTMRALGRAVMSQGKRKNMNYRLLSVTSTGIPSGTDIMVTWKNCEHQQQQQHKSVVAKKKNSIFLAKKASACTECGKE